MRTAIRRHKLLLVSLLLGFCAFALSYSVLSGYVKSGPVVVVLRDLESYVKIGPGDVSLTSLPVKGIPRGAIKTLEDAVGSYTRSRLVGGQTLLGGHIVPLKEKAGLSYDLPSDCRGMFLPVPASRSVGGLVREGERVDLLVAARSLSGGYGVPATPAFTALRGLPVVEVVKDSDSGEFLGIVVLALPHECETIARHLEEGSVYLALVPRTAGDDELRTGVWP